RLPAARHEPRVAGQSRSCDLHLPPQDGMGIGGAVERSRPAWPQAALPIATLAGAKLLRRLRRSHGTRDRLRSREPRRGDRRLRLATDDEERVEGRTDADRPAASQDQVVDQALPRTAEKVPGLS